MICDDTTYQNLILNAGILFFKHDKNTDELSFDINKVSDAFPNVKGIEDIKLGKTFYKHIYFQDRVSLKNYLLNINNEIIASPHYVDIRFIDSAKDQTIWLRIQILENREHDNPVRYGSIQNITIDKFRLISTARKAYTDNLTGLMNRERLKQKIALAIGTAHEYKIEHNIIALNIDYLSTINSMFGYQVTNDLIEEIAKKIASVKRKTDIISRISSGKFAILLIDTKDVDLKEVGERFLEAIRCTNFVTRSGVISVSASGAGCKIPTDANTDENIFAILEQCLTKAKKCGRDHFVQYDINQDNRLMHQENIKISGQIIEAINENRVCTAYQPIIHSHDTHMNFMECLARIKDNEGNFIPAYKFIAVAESIGFIKNIDFKLLENALQDLVKYPHLKLSINLSGHTLYNLFSNIKLMNLLNAHKTVANRLCLELTETIPLQDIENLDQGLSKIKKMGYKIGLDDFGAGYNSFANLYHFDFDIVKLDGSYVKNISENHKNQIFTQTLTELAKRLNIEIVAEMIDNEKDLNLIKSFGIDYFQGYYFSAPSVDFNAMDKLTYGDLGSKENKKVI